jgi:outer membrane protein
MKTLTALSMIVTLACSSSAGEMKVATVDLQRLVKEYYRAEEVAKDLEARHKALFKELVELRLDGTKLLKETDELQELVNDPALSPSAREEKKKSLELKRSDLLAFKQRFDDTAAHRETEWQNLLSQANNRLLDEILVTTRGIGEKEGFNLVLNASKTNPLAGGVLFTKNVDDITEKVLASLNATKPVPKDKSTNSSPTTKQK